MSEYPSTNFIVVSVEKIGKKDGSRVTIQVSSGFEPFAASARCPWEGFAARI